MLDKKYLNELEEFLRIPSVSGEKAHEPDIKAASEWLVAKLKSLGFTAEAMKSSYNPVVVGVRSSEPTSNVASVGARDKKTRELREGTGKDGKIREVPTVLIYGHYDVQSPEPMGEWKSKPFEPTVKNGKLYARGVADDKGQLYTWIAAIEEILKKDGTLPVNVKFVIEGAEEQGSRGLPEFVKKYKDKLKADICVISDSHSLSEKQPVITYGLRGLAYMEVTVTALDTDVHSGIYGGNVMNSAITLAQIITRLKGEDGTIKIPGFYDKVRKITAKEKAELAKYPFSSEDIMAETGSLKITGEKGYSIPARAGARPTLDINGIWGGYQGEGAKTVIPKSASAKISMRLVPNQSSAEIANKFRKFVNKIAPKGVRVEIKELTGSEPVLIDRDSRYFKVAESILTKTFGNKPVYELSGGSIGVVVDFKKSLRIDSLLIGYGLPDDGLHAPNEKMNLGMIEKGIESNVKIIKELGARS